MLRTRLYYQFKPFFPWKLRMAVRRLFATRKRRQTTHVWPIKTGSEKPPVGWPGWPQGKQFAVVLTHDVESRHGLERCRALIELEERLGFRSAFNFVPEGEYSLSQDFREEVARKGFEVGVHDLKHDGKLYQSRSQFSQNASRINRYFSEWGAVGFRSAFMFHNVDWLHELNIKYDASTFDTDPFEPQPDGMHTIFPFWVPRSDPPQLFPASLGDSRHRTDGGYVELPYTLPQDSTLFILLRERSIDLWKKKLDWVASHGGMVLIDTHPDYMAINGRNGQPWDYPGTMYEELLRYIRVRYAGNYWHALPREVADWVSGSRLDKVPAAPSVPFHILRTRPQKPKIWVDLDNTPHVPFFEPILEELTTRGFPLLVTARDAFQVYALADKKGLNYLRVGRHSGKNRLRKAAGLALRSLQLMPIILREKPVLAVSHGARSQILLSNLMRVPTVLIEDYEHCQFPPLMRPTWVLAPDVIPDHALPLKNGHVRKYLGIKEDVYAWKLRPDTSVLRELGIRDSDLLVTVRPPATEAHYHNPEGEKLFESFMHRACRSPQVRVVLLPRNKKQGEFIRAHWPAWFKNDKTVIPRGALDGLNLIWHSDLVVSGGGTMNREAAALRVPVYSIFRGTIGAVDQYLSADGRLVLIESIEDVERKILLVRRPRRCISEITSRRTLFRIVDTIEEIAGKCVRP